MWSHGYVTEIDYTYGFYSEMAPLRLRLALLSKGYAPPPTEELSYLELGFGQGVSINVHSAANPGRFFGTDFNPAQAAHAQEIAHSGATGARLFDDSFDEFLSRSDVPEFNIIALHGIWSWVSVENRGKIVEIIRKKLKPGGIVYISYNALPGWSVGAPLRHLMALHASRSGGARVLDRVDASLQFLEELVAADAYYLKSNPSLIARIKKLKEQNKNYLAHEYYNLDWNPMPFDQVAAELSAAKLDYATSAYLLDHVDAINLTAKARELLGRIKDPILRETTRDYCVPQQFRRDIFIKGARRLSSAKLAEEMEQVPFVLLKAASAVPMKVTGALGEAQLPEALYAPILAALEAEDGRPKTSAEIQSLMGASKQPLSQVFQALVVLTGAGHAANTHPAHSVSTCRATAESLNAELLDRAETFGTIQVLASPLIGTAVAVSRFDQIFLKAERLGREPVAHLIETFARAGQGLLINGKPPADADEAERHVQGLYEEYVQKRRTILRRLIAG